MTIATLRRLNAGLLQRLNPGFAESTHLHVFQPDNGDDQTLSGLLLAGLDWSHDAVARTLLPGPGTCALQWRGAHVRIPAVTLRDVDRSLDEPANIDESDPSDAWYASLLVQMCLAVERERQMAGHAAGESADGSLEGLWLFVARVRSVSAGPWCWWLGATRDGRPSDMVPEELHDSLEDLVRALAGIAMTAPVAGIAHASGETDARASTSGSADGSTDGRSQSFDPGGFPAVERLAGALDAYGPEIPQPISVTPKAPMNGDPVFGELSQRRAKITVSAAAGCAILAAGLAWQTGLFSTPSLPTRDLSFTVPAHGAVRGACLDGLADIWPRMPGWTATAAGCARAGYLPKDIGAPAGDASHVIVWHTYDRDGDANAVLASVAAGELLKAHGQGAHHGHLLPGSTTGAPGAASAPANAKRLVLWRRMAIETRQAEPGGFEPMDQVERMLSQAFADVPGAVTAERNTLTVTVPDPPHRALDRLAFTATPNAVSGGSPAAIGTSEMIEPVQVDLMAVERRNHRTVLQLQPGRVPRPDRGGKAAGERGDRQSRPDDGEAI